MRSWLPAIAVGGLLAVAAVTAVLVWSDAPPATAAERADALARELRCPDCQGLSVADSPTRSAQEIRRQIDALLADGEGEDDVRAHFVARYGEWILLAPTSPSVWVIPFAVVTVAAAALLVWLRTRSKPDDGAGPAASEEERRRVHEEAEALDA